MFCLKRRSHPKSSVTSSSSATVYPGDTEPSRGFVIMNQPQHQANSRPRSHSTQDLPCPVSFYPYNVYGQGLESDWGKDARINMSVVAPNCSTPVVDPSIPLPPGAVVIQVIQPSAPPLSPRDQPQLLPSIYPHLTSSDQNYANQQMALQKY